jgi:hypothetical protein
MIRMQRRTGVPFLFLQGRFEEAMRAALCLSSLLLVICMTVDHTAPKISPIRFSTGASEGPGYLFMCNTHDNPDVGVFRKRATVRRKCI